MFSFAEPVCVLNDQQSAGIFSFFLPSMIYLYMIKIYFDPVMYTIGRDTLAVFPSV